MIQPRNLLVSLIVAGLFAWVMSTKLPAKAALVTGAAAGVFNYAAVAYIAHTERRALARRGEAAARTERT